MRETFAISLLFNLILIYLGTYIIYKKGGWRFIKKKLRVGQVLEDSGYGPYYDQRKSLFKMLPKTNTDILFIGHSLMDGAEWAELLENPHVKNRGINGEIIEGVLHRLDDITMPPPDKIFLMIGTNDIDHGFKTPQILKNYEKIVVKLKQNCPNTKVYTMGMLPIFPYNRNKVGSIPEEFNAGLQQLAAKNGYTYVDLYNVLKDDRGNLPQAYSNDGWHLMGEAYVKVAQHLKNYLKE